MEVTVVCHGKNAFALIDDLRSKEMFFVVKQKRLFFMGNFGEKPTVFRAGKTPLGRFVLENFVHIDQDEIGRLLVCFSGESRFCLTLSVVVGKTSK